jgi:hypothetical protein
LFGIYGVVGLVSECVGVGWKVRVWFTVTGVFELG